MKCRYAMKFILVVSILRPLNCQIRRNTSSTYVLLCEGVTDVRNSAKARSNQVRHCSAGPSQAHCEWWWWWSLGEYVSHTKVVYGWLSCCQGEGGFGFLPVTDEVSRPAARSSTLSTVFPMFSDQNQIGSVTRLQPVRTPTDNAFPPYSSSTLYRWFPETSCSQTLTLPMQQTPSFLGKK